MPKKPVKTVTSESCSFPLHVMLATYVGLGLMTFGHVFNNNYVEPVVIECGYKPDVIKDYDGNRAWYECRYRQIDAEYEPKSNLFLVGFPAVAAGAAWPIYWAGRIAIEATK